MLFMVRQKDRPSWRSKSSFFTREAAEKLVAELKQRFPACNFVVCEEPISTVKRVS